jgi:Ni,Fe-hydrogenase III large subunit/Ni,Fe-hydrogenase III component G
MTPERTSPELRFATPHGQGVTGATQARNVERGEIPAILSELTSREHARFVDVFGIDHGAELQLNLLLAVDARGQWRHLRMVLPREDATFPSITTTVSAADWYEREIWSELGASPEGHPSLAVLRLPTGWPQAVYPLRQGWKWKNQIALSEDGQQGSLHQSPEGVVDYPLGPIRSGVVESGHYLLRTVGEEIVDIRLRLFYKHRGIETLAVGLGPLHLPLVAERISGTDAFHESLALCQALETIAGVQCPPRAIALRTLYAELERLYNHFGYQADLCQATGLVVAQAQFDILKQRVLRLNRSAGHRYLFGLNIPGGLSRDLDGEDAWFVRDQIDLIRRDFSKVSRLTFSSPSHLDRLEGTGILTPADASAYATVGPIARASDQNRDLRRDFPYAGYRDVDFDVPIQSRGDALARARVRQDETFQSLRILMQILDHLPSGPVCVAVTELPANRYAFGWAESARGETLHWVFTDSAGRVRRYRVRTASFVNCQAFPLAVPGHNILTDFPVIEQSFGLSYAGNDR